MNRPSRRAGLFVRRGVTTVRATRRRLIRGVALLLAAFVAFNGVTGLLDGGDPVRWISAAVVLVIACAVWRAGSRLAGSPPR
jgi:peptidoglycan/LPS O-acetylase OafA/YrhL